MPQQAKGLPREWAPSPLTFVQKASKISQMPDSPPWTVRRILEWTIGFFTRKRVDAPRLSAELLLAHVLQSPRIKLYTDYDRALQDAELATFRQLVQRAAEQEPIAYLTGRAHFFNLEFDVSRDVLIPRPDTELLVESVMQRVRNQSGMEAPRVLDLCTGSGCVAAAIAWHVKTAIIVATDISAAAVKIARENLRRLGLESRSTVEQGDLFEPLAALPDLHPFDMIVANPPYIATPQLASLDRSVRDYEPLLALDGGPDGLDFHRRILAAAPRHLVPAGRVYLEIAFDQGKPALDLLTASSNWKDPRLLRDHAGNDRVITAQKA
jgi:release factor glutamine methyltransferase